MTRVVHMRQAVALAGRFPALAGVDLSVAQGEVVVLTGPNGAGKTSLLRACAGLLPVSHGEAVVLGSDLRRDRSSVRRKVAMLGHAAAVYDDLTVRENVRFALRASRVATDADISAALERVGLVGRLERTQAARLSAGQRKRIGLAVIAARRVPLWLLDEPHAGLDADARTVLRELVKEAAAAGTSVLVASHELSVSAELADRVAHMAGGRVVSDLGSDSGATVTAPLAPAPTSVTEVTTVSCLDDAPVRGGVNVA